MIPKKQKRKRTVLADFSPELAAQWHLTKNGEVTLSDVVAGSYKKYWWKCDVADVHEWAARTQSRAILGRGCSYCTLTPRSASGLCQGLANDPKGVEKELAGYLPA